MFGNQSGRRNTLNLNSLGVGIAIPSSKKNNLKAKETTAETPSFLKPVVPYFSMESIGLHYYHY